MDEIERVFRHAVKLSNEATAKKDAFEQRVEGRVRESLEPVWHTISTVMDKLCPDPLCSSSQDTEVFMLLYTLQVFLSGLLSHGENASEGMAEDIYKPAHGLMREYMEHKIYRKYDR